MSENHINGTTKVSENHINGTTKMSEDFDGALLKDLHDIEVNGNCCKDAVSKKPISVELNSFTVIYWMPTSARA